MAIDRDDALRKAEKLLRQGRLDGAIAEYEQVVDAYPDDIATASALGDLYGRAGKAPQAVAQFMRLGDHFLTEGVQAKAAASYRKVLKLDPAPRGRAPPAGRGLRAAGPAGRRQDAPPGGDRQAQGARRPGRRRHARHPPRRARPERLRSAPAGGLDPGPDRQGRHRRPAGAGQGARLAQARQRGRGAARGSRQARSRRHRGVAPPGEGRARPRRGRARQALPARHQHGARIRSCCSPAARSCSSSTTSTPPATTSCASSPRRPRRWRKSPRSASTWRRPTRATPSSTSWSTTPPRPATSARRRAGCRASWRRRRAISRRCCGWSRSASTAISTRR